MTRSKFSWVLACTVISILAFSYSESLIQYVMRGVAIHAWSMSSLDAFMLGRSKESQALYKTGDFFKLEKDVPVQVLLDSGETVTGLLTPKAVDGRNVRQGARVRLDCSQQKKSLCKLMFISVDGANEEGARAPWYIMVDPDGTPDETLLVLAKKKTVLP